MCYIYNIKINGGIVMDFLDKIMTFLEAEAFKIANFSILWWYVIAAAAAVVVLLIVITIIVAVSKKKKKKAKKAMENENIDNSSLVQNSKDEENIVEQPQQVATTIDEQPIAEVAIENIAIPEPEVIENDVKVEEPVAVATQPVAPTQTATPVTPVTPAQPVNNAESVKYVAPAPKATAVEENKQSDATIAEKIAPIPTPIEVVEKPNATPVAPTKVAEEVVQPKPVTYVEPQKTPVQQPVQQTPTYTYVIKPQQNNVVKEAPTATTAEEENEAVATTVPRSLPKKTTKTTKKTAAQIASEIEEKTGSNPRKTASENKPAVVGQNKLPKKAKTKATTTTDENAEEELPIITTDPTVESFGKFVIIKNDSNSARPYHFRLLANNGQILFESESYKSKPKSNSIVAFKKAAVNEDNFEKDMDKAGNWRFKLYNNQHAVIGVGESYSTKQGCENSVQSVIKFAESARFLEDQSE